MKVIEILSSKQVKAFHKLPFSIYKDSKAWIPHVKQEVEKVFNPQHNRYFRHGTACRWLLVQDSKVIGRIAAFVDERRSETEDQPTGGFGFFECINDQSAANLLLDTAKTWLENKGMEAMDGPINFGERNKYWGLLIDGFDKKPNYGNNYHLPYYQELIENYGLKQYFLQHCFIRPVTKPLDQKYYEKAARIEDLDYTFTDMTEKPLLAYADDFRNVYNLAWKTHHGFKEMSVKQSRAVLKGMKPVLNKEAGWFAYRDKQVAGFIIFLPELNEIFERINGNMNFLGKIRFLFFKTFFPPKNLWAVVFGIHPDHQKKGLEGGLFKALADKYQHTNKFQNLIISWIGDFNPKMLHIIRSVGAEDHQLLATYRMLFNPNLEHKPCPKVQ